MDKIKEKTFEEFMKAQTAMINKMASDLYGKSLHTKAPGDSGTYTELHGDGSLFGSQSIDRDVVSAHVRPQGIATRLPLFPSVMEDPRYATLTGFTATNGTLPTNPCDPQPSGFSKACNLTAQFGRVGHDTQTIDITKVMLKRNRGDFSDLRLLGKVMGMSGLTPASMNDNDILNLVTKNEMVITAVATERKLSTTTWQGTPASNTAGGGYKEFPGLDNQIAVGQVDADTNTACPAIDSDVKNFAFDLVDGSGRDIVEYISMLEYYLRYNADTMGLSPVTWVAVMSPGLWQELSAVWPCRYMTDRCSTSTGTNPMVINDGVNVNARDEMRNNKYITINGNRYDVITDTGMYEWNSTNSTLPAGRFAGTFAFVPLTILGGFPVTYREHVDYRAAQPDSSLLRGAQNFFWSDDGLYIWAAEYNRLCYVLSHVTEQRVILRTPQLAGKVEQIAFEPLQHLRDTQPDSPYFQDGGVSLRGDTTAYAVWS